MLLPVHLKQTAADSCGQAALTMALQALGYSSGQEALSVVSSLVDQHEAENSNPPIVGHSLMALIRSAEDLGFATRAVRVTSGSLTVPGVTLPAVAQVRRGDLNHFVAVYRANDRAVCIGDPAEDDRLVVGVYQFCQVWTGVLLMLGPPEPVVAERRSRL